MNFKEWMLANSVKQSTANHYSQAILGTLNRLCLENSPGLSLSEVETVEEWDALADQLKNSHWFKILDSKGHRMYSCAMNKYRLFKDYSSRVDQLLVDIEALRKDTSLSTTQTEQIIKARIGQGKYRRNLLILWEGKCSVTNYPDSKMLIASHIKPWFSATNQERLDPYNGLLLTPNLDKAFDSGLITFDPRNQGRIVFSDALVQPLDLGISDNMKLSHLRAKTAEYLQSHISQVFVSR